MLRRLAKHLRSGGIIVFHEPDWSFVRSEPTEPTYDRCCQWIYDEHDSEKYKWRHLIENFFCRIKAFRRIATRYERTGRVLRCYAQSRRRHALATVNVNRP